MNYKLLEGNISNLNSGYMWVTFIFLFVPFSVFPNARQGACITLQANFLTGNMGIIIVFPLRGVVGVKGDLAWKVISKGFGINIAF